MHFEFALKGLDYLHGLEKRRRREFGEMLARLGIDENKPSSSSIKYPEETSASAGKVDACKKVMDGKAKSVEDLYTQAYVGLRRWVGLLTMGRAGRD